MQTSTSAIENKPPSVGLDNVPNTANSRLYEAGLAMSGKLPAAGRIPIVILPKRRDGALAMMGDLEDDDVELKRQEDTKKRFLEEVDSFHRHFFKDVTLDVEALKTSLPLAIGIADMHINILKDSPDFKGKKEALREAKEEKQSLIRLRDFKLPEMIRKMKGDPPEFEDLQSVKQDIAEETRKSSILSRIFSSARNAVNNMRAGAEKAAYNAAAATQSFFEKRSVCSYETPQQRQEISYPDPRYDSPLSEEEKAKIKALFKKAQAKKYREESSIESAEKPNPNIASAAAAEAEPEDP